MNRAESGGKYTLRAYPDCVDIFTKYWYEEPVPVDIYIDGQKVAAPNAGVRIGHPIFPDVDKSVGLSLGNYFATEKGKDNG